MTHSSTEAGLLLLAVALFVGSLILASCNTTAGVGRDVEKVGHTIQKAARHH